MRQTSRLFVGLVVVGLNISSRDDTQGQIERHGAVRRGDEEPRLVPAAAGLSGIHQGEIDV
jgi:hypothetical protein